MRYKSLHSEQVQREKNLPNDKKFILDLARVHIELVN